MLRLSQDKKEAPLLSLCAQCPFRPVFPDQVGPIFQDILMIHMKIEIVLGNQRIPRSDVCTLTIQDTVIYIEQVQKILL